MRGTAMGRKATVTEEAEERNDGDGREARQFKYGACGLKLGIVTGYILVGRFPFFPLCTGYVLLVYIGSPSHEDVLLTVGNGMYRWGLAWKVME